MSWSTSRWRELSRSSGSGCLLTGRASPVVGDEMLRHDGAQIRLTARDGGDAQLQLGEVGVLQQVAGGARLQRLQGVLLAGVHRQDDHGGAGMTLDDACRGLEPVQPRHRDVHEDEARPQLVDELDDLVSVLRFPDHLDARDAR